MAGSSNRRVIEVIDFLASHPTEAFTLSELAERLSLSHGSAHRVLGALTEARYLSRHPTHKTYSLGLALVAIGQAALEKHQAVEVARREMSKLAEQLQARCIATAIVDDEMLFVAKAGVPQRVEALSRVGERRPFIPPLALSHVAWADEKSLQRYLNRAPHGLGETMRRYVLDAIAEIRRRGYAVAAMGTGLAALRQLVNDHADNYREAQYWAELERLIGQLSEDEIQLLDLSEVATVGISYIAAPVFSPSGEVVLEISLSGLPDNLSEAEVVRYAERLRAVADVVTSETHGRVPRS